jgi:hypothetical protein
MGAIEVLANDHIGPTPRTAACLPMGEEELAWHQTANSPSISALKFQDRHADCPKSLLTEFSFQSRFQRWFPNQGDIKLAP